jgi:pimeloyl-ACP methyl ester carboxylesterase
VGAPPASLLLVHGAGSGPWVFDGWPGDFPGVAVAAVDLQAGIDVCAASMADYADAVVAAAAALPAPAALCGWSMGGLVALMAAERAGAARLVLLESSPPAEVQGYDGSTPIGPGTFDPEEAYGPFPPGMRARPESSLARAERRRGISVPRLPCPALVVSGDEFAQERGRALAQRYGSEELSFPGLDHWGLVLDERVRNELAGRLDNNRLRGAGSQ